MALLIVSREIGQSLVIAEHVLLTVAVLGQDFVDLGLTDLSGRPLGVVTVAKGSSTNVIHGVRGTFIGMRGTRAQLGFEHPANVNITRLEFFANNDSWNER
jgi:sRNA-binding carbon storage regulator CsrA